MDKITSILSPPFSFSSIYIHIPFCRHLCSYCDFYKFSPKDEDVVDLYIDALSKEMHLYQEFGISPSIGTTIFIGGGTPNWLSCKQIDRLGMSLEPFMRNGLSEFSVEMNPELVTEETLKAWYAIGVRRVSLGIQSTFDHLLVSLGREGRQHDAEKALDLVRKVGFESVNADLIYGIPRQTLSDWSTSLAWVVRRGFEHISTYELTVGASHPLKRQQHAFMRSEHGLCADASHEEAYLDESVRSQAHYTASYLPSEGFHRYELSNWAKDGKLCQHNWLNWHRQSLLAFGPSGAGFLGQKVRYQNVPSLKRYRHLVCEEGLLPVSEVDVLDDRKRWIEQVLLGLRLVGQGLEPMLLSPKLVQEGLSDGWLREEGVGKRIHPTQEGLHVLDAVSRRLVDEPGLAVL